MIRMTCLLRTVACGFCVLLLSGVAAAQFNAGVQGSVKESSGALVPHAVVKLTNRATNQTSQVITSREGFYRFSALAPGEYTLKTEKTGFEGNELNITVRAESIQGFDIVLNPTGVAGTVTVTGTTEQAIETENANVDRAITNQKDLRLPQFGRDPYELVRLTPGIFGQGARSSSGGAVNLPNTTGPGGSSTSIFQAENQVPISANGQRVSANNFQIDGVSTNSLNWGGAAVITPNQEAVKELRVLSSAYSAEFGRNSGAQILVVSQNGTNEYHGSAFYKYNNPGLNAFNKLGSTIGAAGFRPPVRVEN